jgi:protease-4
MAMSNDSTSTQTVLYVIVVVVAVLVSSVLAPIVWGVTQPSDDGEERSSVAVITLRGGTSSANAAAISEDLRDARNNESIEAVVLRMDSGGGAVTSSSELYLAVNRTAQEMPVVAYVEGVAASGGYYAIAPADAIYVKPSSIVGSIGVVATVPQIVEENNRIVSVQIRSGPDKQVQSVDQIRNQVESLQNSFVGTVFHHRGDDISLTREEVSRAGVYIGTRAVENGLADQIGSLESAIQRAAEESENIEGDDYDVTYMEPPSTGLGIILAEQNVDSRNGSVVYVDTGADETDDEFVPPVEFHAVWGIPEDATVEESQEVTINETN